MIEEINTAEYDALLITEFQSAISNALVQPKAVKIGHELWVALKKAGLIQMRDVAADGIFELGWEMPCYGDILIIFDPEIHLGGKQFKLPPHAILSR